MSPEVVDGDTLLCGEERVRLLGIDAPERKATDRAYEQALAFGISVDTLVWLGEEATRHLASLLAACANPMLEFDAANNAVGHRDRYGRLLAYLACEWGDAGERMLRDGWADLLTDYPLERPGREEGYEAAYRGAVEERRGMWAYIPFPDEEKAFPETDLWGDSVEGSLGGCFVRSVGGR